MANANYFGFTHGGTQYGAQPATAYPAAAQTTYVQQTHQTAYATVPRAQTYEPYQATHTTPGQYAYATRTQPTAAYDTSKTYYAPTAAAAPAATTAVYTIAETPYQPAKPAYSTTSYSSTNPHRTASAGTKSLPVGHSTSQPSYVYTSTTSASNANVKLPGSTGYDAALYSAATNYYQQQQVSKTPTSGGGGGGTSNTTPSWQSKKPFIQKPKSKPPPKQPQLHYCEVCKISCAGPQTYREHLEGQKHKKKEAAAKGANPLPTGRGQNQLRCELCDVACTGSDAYAAHIRGTKHQKVLKLHTRLGKPIPSSEPTVVSGNTSVASSANKTAAAGGATSRAPVKPSATATNVVTKKVLATPKITFVGGTQLKSAGGETKEVKKDAGVKPDVTSPSATTTPAEGVTTEDKNLELSDNFALPGEKDITPVGEEYIDEVRNELGNVVSFNCKLCECKFNDPNAKIMHLKGRRHRLQYKKKVDPSLQVEVKPSIRIRKIQEEKLRRQAAKEEYWRRRDAEERWRMEWEQRRYEEYVGWQRGPQGRPFGMGGPGMHMRRPDTSDDRHVLAKHQSIYPNEAELAAVQNIVSSCEKALKLVSDFIAESDAPKPMETDKKEVKEEKVAEEEKEGKEGSSEKEEPPQPPRALKGVMRVGVLAKGLLLHGDLTVHLVVLCSEKPTRTLLERVADSLPKQLATVTDEKYEVKRCVEEAALIVSSEKDPKSTCTVTMTSPIMRDENNPDGESSVESKPDPPDVLDRQKCLGALAALRHAKWFQARANGLQSCVIVIRILRDLCQRVPTWTPLTQWAMELLVEKCVSSAGTALNPGDALRRVFECIASGILLPGGPGLYDPCEKEPYDAASSLSSQEREDITASAQHALRLIAFRQIHKVLGMDPLPTPKHLQGKRMPRKRRRTNSTGEGPDGEGEGKKDKKEEGEGEEIKEEAKA